MPGESCDGLCRGPESCDSINPNNCKFLAAYFNQLNKLNFDEIMARFEKLGKVVQKKEKFFEEPIAVLLVHEAPNNPCSERWAIKKWFAQHGYELEEWHK